MSGILTRWKLSIAALFLCAICSFLAAAERPPQAPLPPQAPAVKAAPARTACTACDCSVTGICTCGPECSCSLKVINDIFTQAAKDDLDPRYRQFAQQTGGKAPKSHHKSYATQYDAALKTGKPLIVWVGCGSQTCEEDCPQFLHAYERTFPETVGPAVVIAKVVGGKLIHVETVEGIPSCDTITGALVQRGPASSCGPNGCSLVGRSTGSCSTGSCSTGSCGSAGDDGGASEGRTRRFHIFPIFHRRSGGGCASGSCR